MAAELHVTPARATDTNGSPYSGAKWFFYDTGTTTPRAVYSDALLAVSLGSVVTADSGGKFPDIYFDSSFSYRGVCKSADGSITLHDTDPVNPGVLSSIATSVTTAEAITTVTRVGQMKLSYLGTGMVLDQEQPNMRGELYLNPNGNDLFAAGELTCLYYDRRLPGRELGPTGSNGAFVFYASRDGTGTTIAGRIRTLSSGTQPLLPIEIDSTGGAINAGFRTNGKGWYYNELQIGGTWADPDVPGGAEAKLRLGPCIGPTIDFEDTFNASSRKGQFRNLGGTFALINVDAGTIPWQVDLSTRTTTMHNVVATGTFTVAIIDGSTAAFTTTNTSSRPADFRNSNAAFTGAVVFAAHSNTTLGSGYLFQGFDLNAGTTKVLIYDNGNIQNTNNSYGAISDRKFKQDIELAGSQWGDVKALSAALSKYRMKAEVAADPAAPLHLGLIAQDALAISPGLVDSNRDSTTGEEYLALKYSILNLKALGALGEAMARIEALEAKLRKK